MDAAQDSMLLLCRVVQSGGTLAPHTSVSPTGPGVGLESGCLQRPTEARKACYLQRGADSHHGVHWCRYCRPCQPAA
jgi:hypothetical protein